MRISRHLFADWHVKGIACEIQLSTSAGKRGRLIPGVYLPPHSISTLIDRIFHLADDERSFASRCYGRPLVFSLAAFAASLSSHCSASLSRRRLIPCSTRDDSLGDLVASIGAACEVFRTSF